MFSNDGVSFDESSEKVDLDESYDDESSRVTKDHIEKETKTEVEVREEIFTTYVRVNIVISVICGIFIVCCSVWYFASMKEKDTFQQEFDEYASYIESSVVWKVKYNMALLQQLGATTTSVAAMTQQTFPNVTLPDFEVSGGYVDGMGTIMMTLSAPLVPVSGREEWEEYAATHNEWLDNSEWLKTTYAKHRDPLHATFQDYEHDPNRHLTEKSLQNPDERKAQASSLSSEGDYSHREFQEDDQDIQVPSKIWKWDEDEKVVIQPQSTAGYFAPLWQSSPADAASINVDLLSDPVIEQLFTAMNKTRQTVMSQGIPMDNLFDWMFSPEEKNRKAEPHAYIMEPMYSNFSWESSEPVGFFIALTNFRSLFTRILPEGTSGIYCVVTATNKRNGKKGRWQRHDDTTSCSGSMTFRLDGPEASFLGYDDLHTGYDDYEQVFAIELYESTTDELCVHDLHIYPSHAFHESYQTNGPAIFASIAAITFGVTLLLLCIYDILVTRKQEKTKKAALRVVSSLFPSQYHKTVLRGHTDEGDNNDDTHVAASLYPETTIMFADISGFTAWSSTREPTQVFLLLETIYGAFDEIARKSGIFKVETVGDCYVAVAGCPEPMKDHAVSMVKFARRCQESLVALSQELETTLGPETADLAFRIGLHSGPVTGGVLRGQNSRFQLFGDTMNMASRMETTGARDRIHISSDTAKLLIQAGKSKWLEKRKESVDVKGKGQQETYWVKSTCYSQTDSSTYSESVTVSDLQSEKTIENRALVQSPLAGASRSTTISKKIERLVDWTTAILKQRLVNIQRHRNGIEKIDEKVEKELRDHITGIATMYRSNNSFHNFEHASHVSASLVKMLSRVEDDKSAVHIVDEKFTNDISSDPLAQFAVLYACLVHDVDHAGVSNDQLVKEGVRIASIYDNKSVAEKHSYHLAWDYLTGGDFPCLIELISGGNPTELDRFSTILSNAVLATDFFDKDRKKDRDERWAAVFNPDYKDNATVRRNFLKAQIVLELVIQAADVAHTMQHWDVYRKWNERLFAEMTDAFKAGRMSKDPAEFWYQGEMSFFDSYIIPLAKKINDCGVFGASSDEFLMYAKENRREWELNGEDVVAELKAKFPSTE